MQFIIVIKLLFLFLCFLQVCAEQELRMNGYSNCHLEPPHKAFHLSKPVRAALCQCLDTPKAKGNDWRLLAMKLGVDG